MADFSAKMSLALHKGRIPYKIRIFNTSTEIFQCQKYLAEKSSNDGMTMAELKEKTAQIIEEMGRAGRKHEADAANVRRRAEQQKIS